MIAMPTVEKDPRPWYVRTKEGFLHPVEWLRKTSGNGPLYALVVLFALNMVDESDRTGFAVLIPNIRDAFSLTNAGILTIIGIVSFVGLSLSVPISMFADRHHRVRMMVLGGAAFAIFSATTGLI